MYYLISKHESKKKKDAQVLKLLFQHLPILAPLIGLINWDIDLIPANIRAILQLITKIINFLIGELLTSPDCTLRTLPRDRWLIGMIMILFFLFLAAISYKCRRSRVGNDIHTAMFKMYQDILFRPVVVMTMLVWHCTDRGDGQLISSQMIGGGLDGSVCPIDFNNPKNEFTLALFFMLINLMLPLIWEIVSHLERDEGSGVQKSLTLNLKNNVPFRYWSLVVTIQKLLVLVPLAVAIRQDDDGCKIRPPWTQMWILTIIVKRANTCRGPCEDYPKRVTPECRTPPVATTPPTLSGPHCEPALAVDSLAVVVPIMCTSCKSRAPYRPSLGRGHVTQRKAMESGGAFVFLF